MFFSHKVIILRCSFIYIYILFCFLTTTGVEAHRYVWNSYSKYTIMKRPITWYDRYVTNYMVQVRTLKENGVILHEEGSRYSRAQQQIEFSTLQVFKQDFIYFVDKVSQ